MKVEHLKGWLDEIQCKEKAARENPGREGADMDLGCKWRIFVELIQIVWEQEEIPEQMSWMVVVLLPKGGGDFQGMGLLDPCWKVVKKNHGMLPGRHQISPMPPRRTPKARDGNNNN
jgi:hypothetical protein